MWQINFTLSSTRLSNRAKNRSSLAAQDRGAELFYATQRGPSGTTSLFILLFDSPVFEWLIGINFCHYVIASNIKYIASEANTMKRHRISLFTLITLITLVITPAAVAEIYKCDGPDGPIFSDKKCGSDAANVELPESSG